ncbi:MAG: response regulator [Betaproteobacteria bacterium]
MRSESARPLRIIIADDDQDLVMTLVTILRNEGHDVLDVYRGDDVVPLARKFRPDVLILDIGMPGQSGYAIAQEVKADSPQNAKPLLIAISGQWKKPTDQQVSKLVGFDHYLVKPADPKEVIRLLEELKEPSR